MDIGLVIIVVAVAQSYGSSETLTAYPSNNSYSVDRPRSNHLLTIYIQPARYYSSHYLEISWSTSHFDVKADMPECNENSVEVYLTRKNKNIGSFCSNNAGHPFTMYSVDGYARIDYRTNKCDAGKGFTFYYMLKPRTTHIGGHKLSTTCYNTQNNGTAGLMYSTGWPTKYLPSVSNCTYVIQPPYSGLGVLISFMDIDVNPSVDHGDCVKLFATFDSPYFGYSTFSIRFCHRNFTRYVNLYFGKYIKITFDRKYRNDSYRGFVAGYISYNNRTSYCKSTNPPFKDPAASSRISSTTIGIILGTVLPAVVLIIIVIIAVIHSKQRCQINVGREDPSNITFTVTQSNSSTPNEELKSSRDERQSPIDPVLYSTTSSAGYSYKAQINASYCSVVLQQAS